jgi:DNA-binding FadR family transcriptional regulator
MIIRHERLYEQVTRALALRILGGTLSPDSVRNTEAELCRDLGVSRTVLREAVKVLAAKGLVEVRPKTGMRIKPRSEWTLIDRDVMAWQAEIGFSEDYVRNLFQVRLMLEPPTALAAAANATQEDLDGIREAFGRMERELDDFSAYVEDDCDFHDRISRATHNDYLIQINRIILDAVRGAQSLFQKERGPAKYALDLHKDVCEAILHRDLEWAKSAMTRLIHEAEKDTLHALKNQDQHLDQSAIRTNPASLRKKPKKSTTEVPAVGV